MWRGEVERSVGYSGESCSCRRSCHVVVLVGVGVGVGGGVVVVV